MMAPKWRVRWSQENYGAGELCLAASPEMAVVVRVKPATVISREPVFAVSHYKFVGDEIADQAVWLVIGALKQMGFGAFQRQPFDNRHDR
jgi:hypothetical protein